MSFIAKYTVVYQRPIFGEQKAEGFVESPDAEDSTIVRLVRNQYGKDAIVIVWWTAEIKPAKNWEGL